MATFSKKMMGKEVGDAKVYAPPHTMSGGALKDDRANRSSANTVDMSVGMIKRDPEGPPAKTKRAPLAFTKRAHEVGDDLLSR